MVEKMVSGPQRRVVETLAGTVELAFTENGLYALELPVQENLGLTPVGCEDPAWLRKLAEQLQAYFAGEPVQFECPLDDRDYPPFHWRVLCAAFSIPYGENRSYKWLAQEAQSPRASRAAGQAMAFNRTPVVVPCHRVLRSDGGLGGFSGGLGWKTKLLELEQTAKGGS